MPSSNKTPSFDQINVLRWRELPEPDTLVAGIDTVFFESSGTKSFESKAAREDFRERWLGRYLTQNPEYVYVAVAEQQVGSEFSDRQVVGYLVGAIDDPIGSDRFADLGYFQHFKSVTAQFPAQLHVNLLSRARGQGLGQCLVEMFVRDAEDQGVKGIHVVTSEGARNISFYAKCGFREVAKTDWNERTLVFLGRNLSGY